MSKWPIAISMYSGGVQHEHLLGFTGWVNRPRGTIWICLRLRILMAVPLIVWLYPTLL